MQLEAHAPSVPPSETIPPPGLTEDSTLTPLTALTALDDAIENLGVPVPCRSYDPEVFFAESPATPWPANAGEYSAFSTDYATERAVDLTRSPLDKDRDTWTDKTDYSGCQGLADRAREARIDLIKYESVRCLDRGTNVAILDCAAFASRDIGDRQTWRILLNASGVRLICEFPKLVLNFDRDAFVSDPRIAGMTWER